MGQYTIVSDYEKQRLLRRIAALQRERNKPLCWVLEQLGIAKSTYYDWRKSGGVTQSKAPHRVWNKTPPAVAGRIAALRNDAAAYRSERTAVGIADALEREGIFMTAGGVWSVLKRQGLNRLFAIPKKQFIIYPKAEKFFTVVCIDDSMFSNRKPRDTAIFNAIDEYSQEVVGSLFIAHRVNRFDVIALFDQIKARYGRLPHTVRLDNAKAHISRRVREYCREHRIRLQFIDPGTPQQNWPIEAFQHVITNDLVNSPRWRWDTYGDKQQLLDEYRQYYNVSKPLASDPLKRTPHEIATAVTSARTQQRLKYRLLRKHRGQVAARCAMLQQRATMLPRFVRNVR